MFKRLFFRILHEIEQRPVCYAIAGFAMLAGIVGGWVLPSCLSEPERASLTDFVQSWLQSTIVQTPDFPRIFLQSLFNHGRWVALLLISGLFRLGSPVAVLSEFCKGIGVGFSVGSFCLTLGFAGFWGSLWIVWLPNLLFIPLYLLLGARALARSSLPGGPARTWRARRNYLKKAWPYLAAFLVGIVLECIGVPYMTKWLGPLLLQG